MEGGTAVTGSTQILAETPALQRTFGEGRLSAKHLNGRTRIARLYQSGAAKIRMPRLVQSDLEAVLINTSGGLTGGDRVSWQMEAGAGTQLTLTTQACEKIYRASDGVAEVHSRIDVRDGARIDWLPQETILFDRSALNRRLDVHLSGNAEFMAVEPVILGRTGMGETVATARFHDCWRIYRDDELIHAEDTRLSGNFPAMTASAAALAGKLAFATLFYAGAQAEALAARIARLCDGPTTGCSAWDDKLVVRLVAADGFGLRKVLLPILAQMRDKPLPRIWHN